MYFSDVCVTRTTDIWCSTLCVCVWFWPRNVSNTQTKHIPEVLKTLLTRSRHLERTHTQSGALRCQSFQLYSGKIAPPPSNLAKHFFVLTTTTQPQGLKFSARPTLDPVASHKHTNPIQESPRCSALSEVWICSESIIFGCFLRVCV